MCHIRIASPMSLPMDRLVLVVHIHNIQLLFKLHLLGILRPPTVLVVAGLENMEIGLMRTYFVKMVYCRAVTDIILVFVYLLLVSIPRKLTFTVIIIDLLAIFKSILRLIKLQLFF